MLTDFILSERASIATLDLEDLSGVPRLRSRRVGPLKLEKLVAIADGFAPDSLFDSPPTKPLRMEADGCLLLLEVPDELAETCLSWDTAELRRVAEGWAQTAEMRCDGWTPEHAIDFLQELQTFLVDNAGRGELFHLIVI